MSVIKYGWLFGLTSLVLILTLGCVGSYHSYLYYEEARTQELGENAVAAIRRRLEISVKNVDRLIQLLGPEATGQRWEASTLGRALEGIEWRDKREDPRFPQGRNLGVSILSDHFSVQGRKYRVAINVESDREVPMVIISPQYDTYIRDFSLSLAEVADFYFGPGVSILAYNQKADALIGLFPSRIQLGGRSNMLSMRDEAHLNLKLSEADRNSPFIATVDRSQYAFFPYGGEMGMLVGRRVNGFYAATLNPMKDASGAILYILAAILISMMVLIYSRQAIQRPLVKITRALINEDKAHLSLKSGSWRFCPGEIHDLRDRVLRMARSGTLVGNESAHFHHDVDCHNTAYLNHIISTRVTACTSQRPGTLYMIAVNALRHSAFEVFPSTAKPTLSHYRDCIERSTLNLRELPDQQVSDVKIGYLDSGRYYVWIEGMHDVEASARLIQQTLTNQMQGGRYGSEDGIAVAALSCPQHATLPETFRDRFMFMFSRINCETGMCRPGVVVFDQQWSDRIHRQESMIHSASRQYRDATISALYAPFIESATGMVTAIYARLAWVSNMTQAVINPFSGPREAWINADPNLDFVTQGMRSMLDDIETMRKSGNARKTIVLEAYREILDNRTCLSSIKQIWRDRGGDDTLVLEIPHADIRLSHKEVFRGLAKEGILIAVRDMGTGKDFRLPVMKMFYARFTHTHYTDNLSGMCHFQDVIRQREGGTQIVHDKKRGSPLESVLSKPSDWFMDSEGVTHDVHQMTSLLQRDIRDNVVSLRR